MTAQGKLDFVTNQLHKMQTEGPAPLECPYCGTSNAPGADLCCMTLGKAVRAWMQRITVQQTAEVATRVLEAMDKIGAHDAGMLVN